MAISNAARKQVRHRANHACEFCGVTETDVGGELTVDHYRPRSSDGSDDLDNLIYCCSRCNLYKADYWPKGESEPHLWNPRREPFSRHFHELEDGTLRSLTVNGEFTLRRLRLNRPQLAAHRLQGRLEASRRHQLNLLEGLSRVLEQLVVQQAMLTRDQNELLKELQDLLWVLLNRGR